MQYQELINQGFIYLYRGDRYTDVQYKMQPCQPVLTSTGKCIRGKNGNMLVSFQSGTIEKAKENQGKRTDISQISVESKPIDTQKEVAKIGKGLQISANPIIEKIDTRQEVVILARQLRRLDKLVLNECSNLHSKLKKVISNQLVLPF